MGNTITVHKCYKINEFYKDIEARNVSHYEYGVAFGDCFTNYGDSEYFWTSNDEYSSPILFCPWCGIDLRKLLPHKKWSWLKNLCYRVVNFFITKHWRLPLD